MTCSAPKDQEPAPVAAIYDIEHLCDSIGAVALTVQGSLFECNERRSLGDGAWIDIRSGWLTGADDCWANC